ncbi:MAG: class I SAM-dependent methyltransferase [Verrucomicrobia bacterium]|nr:class I SAM-dependent methyltransferase [Verrucomicrobiota bacterium]
MDISDLSVSSFGTFDYIIAHGLYSWVAAPVRKRILEICRDLLRPQGIAYVSYNAYPGNHLRDLARGMMRYHVSRFETVADKVGQARGLLKFLAESELEQDCYADVLKLQFERSMKYMDEAFFHDDLSDVNQPFYFHEFMQEAGHYRLRFVGEAMPTDLDPSKFRPGVLEKLHELAEADEIVREQYKDFLRGCAFRQTLLCHDQMELSSDVRLDRISQVHATCDATFTRNNDTFVFRRPKGSEIETPNPIVGFALEVVCSRWPESVSFSQMLDGVRRSNGSSDADVDSNIAVALSTLYRAGFLGLQWYPYQVTHAVSERPLTSRLARTQLSHGESATTQLHVNFRFPDPLSRQLVLLMDGSRTQSQIVSELADFIRAGHAAILEEGKTVSDPIKLGEQLPKLVSNALVSLVREGMMVG